MTRIKGESNIWYLWFETNLTPPWIKCGLCHLWFESKVIKGGLWQSLTTHLMCAKAFFRAVEKLNRCNGCAIHHPSQRQHSCLMIDSEDAWFYFRDDVVENIDLNLVLKTAESVCSALGFKLGNSWETYVTELPKFPWTSIYQDLTSLELEGFSEIVQPKQLQDRILYAIYYGPSGLKWKDCGGMEMDSQVEAQCPETIVRKQEEPQQVAIAPKGEPLSNTLSANLRPKLQRQNGVIEQWWGNQMRLFDLWYSCWQFSWKTIWLYISVKFIFWVLINRWCA